jgi:hypothetical protein
MWVLQELWSTFVRFLVQMMVFSTTLLRNGKKVAMIDFVTGLVASILLMEG